MGTNIGHQIRKLYEPDLYPGNPTERIFQRFFGAGRRFEVCSYGFEPNPLHSRRLKDIELAYRRRGIRITMHTETAVSDYDGNATLYLDHAAGEHNEWGAGLTTNALADKVHLEKIIVRTVDIARWFAFTVQRGATVVMKSDIETLDEKVLNHLYHTGQLCHVQLVYGEHLSQAWLDNIGRLLEKDRCTTRIELLDDESGDDGLGLPFS